MLLGENGAGKTTLASMLCGLLQPDSGSIFINDEKVNIDSSLTAYEKGIAIVHQTPSISKNLKVWQNIILGNEPEAFYGLIDRKVAKKEINNIFKDWDISLPLKTYTYKLSASERFYTALASALQKNPKFLLLDEPTASLDEKQRLNLYENLVKATKRGLGIILITHNVQEAISYGDTITILKKGKIAKQFDNKNRDTTESDILQSVFGLDQLIPAKENIEDVPLNMHTPFKAKKILSLENISAVPTNNTAIFDINFSVYSSMITTIVGQREAGIETLEELITGINPIPFSGNIYFHEKKIKKLTPVILRKNGTSIIPFDKKNRSSTPNITVLEMLSIYNKFINNKKFAKQVISKSKVDTQPEALVSSLSGGMLQKLIIERELARKPNLIFLSEPMHGLDYNSSQAFAKRLRQMADAGSAILILTSTEYHIGTYSDFVFYLTGGKLSTHNSRSIS